MKVTILIPVYEGAAFVGETIRSALAQTHDALEIVVSIDRSMDPSWSVCRAFEGDPRLRVLPPSGRRGWIDHCNSLIAQVATPWFCILPHDDLLAPTYIERLVAIAEETPSAAIVYSDIEVFGRLNVPRRGQPGDPAATAAISQPSLTGTRVERLLAYVAEHYAAVGFRGLVRTISATAAGGLSLGARHGFAADAMWLARLAWEGDALRVPEALYRKRYHDRSVHHGWFALDRAARLDVWHHHCLELAEWVDTLDLSDDARDVVDRALIDRACGRCGSVAFPEVLEQADDEIRRAGRLLNRRVARRRRAIRRAGRQLLRR
ncbi:MAG: glycosyltransferase family A protein [Acidobacteriota bacterium]